MIATKWMASFVLHFALKSTMDPTCVGVCSTQSPFGDSQRSAGLVSSLCYGQVAIIQSTELQHSLANEKCSDCTQVSSESRASD